MRRADEGIPQLDAGGEGGVVVLLAAGEDGQDAVVGVEHVGERDPGAVGADGVDGVVGLEAPERAVHGGAHGGHAGPVVDERVAEGGVQQGQDLFLVAAAADGDDRVDVGQGGELDAEEAQGGAGTIDDQGRGCGGGGRWRPGWWKALATEERECRGDGDERDGRGLFERDVLGDVERRVCGRDGVFGICAAGLAHAVEGGDAVAFLQVMDGAAEGMHRASYVIATVGVEIEGRDMDPVFGVGSGGVDAYEDFVRKRLGDGYGVDGRG